MTNPRLALEIAENLVEEMGDSNWFYEQYTLARQYFGIIESLKVALERQGLLEAYNKVLAKS